MKKITFFTEMEIKEECRSSWGEYIDEYDNSLSPEYMTDTISIIVSDEDYQKILDADDEGDMAMSELYKHLDKDQKRIIDDTNEGKEYWPISLIHVEDYTPPKVNKKIVGCVALAGVIGAVAFYKFK